MQEPPSDALPLTTNDNDDQVTSESLVVPPGDVTAEDPDVITVDSLTLPRIEHVLRSEGVRSLSISQQIDSLRKKVDRCVINTLYTVVTVTNNNICLLYTSPSPRD